MSNSKYKSGDFLYIPRDNLKKYDYDYEDVRLVLSVMNEGDFYYYNVLVCFTNKVYPLEKEYVEKPENYKPF